jgi:uncharacterized delta-60 repeat protein
VLLAIFLSTTFFWRAEAAAGDLDPTFGSGGKTSTDILNDTDLAAGVVVQPDGKIIAGGVSGLDFAVVRYNSDGSLDLSFGPNGRVRTDFFGSFDEGHAVALQSDGKILLAGSAVNSITFQDFALARYNTDGALDPTFGSGGKVTTDFFDDNDEAWALAIQTDGKIVLAGRAATDSGFAFAIARYLPGGSIDPSFGSGGKVISHFSGADRAFAVAVQPDGKILAAGTVIARYNPDGSIDSGFGAGGSVVPGLIVRGLALQSNGKTVAAGSNLLSTDFAVARYDSDGTLDSTFGSGGKVITDFFGQSDVGLAVVIQPDGNLIVSGQVSTQDFVTSAFGLVRYKNDGSLDATFGSGGRVTTDFFEANVSGGASGLALQSDGRIIAAGGAFNSATGWDFVLARYQGGIEGAGFDACLQDDSNGNLLQFNSTTGDYQFTNCSGFTLGGTAGITRRGSITTLQQNGPDRRLLGRLDGGVKKGTASLQVFSQRATFTITDRNTMDNTCSCASSR